MRDNFAALVFAGGVRNFVVISHQSLRGTWQIALLRYLGRVFGLAHGVWLCQPHSW